MTPRPTLVNPPQQQRSRDSLERVLKAGLEVLQEDGFIGFTVQKVSKRAKVSIGSIYARLPNREALILAVYEWAMAWSVEPDQGFERAAVQQYNSPRERIETIVLEFALLNLSHTSEFRIFARQAAVHDEIFARANVKTREVRSRFIAALGSSRDDVRHDDPERALAFVFTMVFSSIMRRISHGPEFDGSTAISDSELAHELAIAAADYLL